MHAVGIPAPILYNHDNVRVCSSDTHLEINVYCELYLGYRKFLFSIILDLMLLVCVSLYHQGKGGGVGEERDIYFKRNIFTPLNWMAVSLVLSKDTSTC